MKSGVKVPRVQEETHQRHFSWMQYRNNFGHATPITIAKRTQYKQHELSIDKHVKSISIQQVTLHIQ